MMAFVLRRVGPSVVAIVLAAFGAASFQAQTPAASAPVHPHKHARKPKAATVAPDPAPVEETPAAPPPPNWPVNAKAERANVSWDGRDLSVKAANSSLQQILHDVSTATGLKVEGLTASSNEGRIYGSYGPASARVVLSALLEGSGYNVLMIGDQGQGTPRVLVLSSKRGGGAKPGGAQSVGGQNQDNDNQVIDEDAPEEPEQPEQPPQPEPQPEGPPHRPFGQPGQGPGVRTPQEIMQELQQRQQIQQQQQQEQLQQQQQQQQEQQQQQPEVAPQQEN